MKFFYDTWEYLASPSIDTADIELDMNQLMKNGRQCSTDSGCHGCSNTSDDAEDSGTPLNLVEDKGAFKIDVQFAYL